MSIYKPMAPLDRIERLIKRYETRIKRNRVTARQTGNELWAQAVRCELLAARELRELRRDLGRDFDHVTLLMSVTVT